MDIRCFFALVVPNGTQNHSMKTTLKIATAGIIACLTLLLCACNYFKHPTPKPSAKPWGVFEGILPCADCSGLKTELTIYDGLTFESYRYILKETYLDAPHGDVVNVRQGAYNFERGNSTDDDAVIYVLDPDSAHSRRFQKLNDSTMLAVDSAGNVIDSTVNFVLKRK